VVLVSPSDTPSGLPLLYRPANSCILPIGGLHGKQLITVEQLGTSSSLHPVQAALVNHHGSQCGFCTPGFVMSLFALFHQNFADKTLWQDTHQAQALIEHSLGGNLCRCTGYAPIIQAAEDVLYRRFEMGATDAFDAAAATTAKTLNSIKPSRSHAFTFKHSQDVKVHVPTSLESALRLWKSLPEAEIIAGGTDKALDITQSLKRWDALIHLGEIPELKVIEHQDEALKVGAGVSIANLIETLAKDYPDSVPMVLRFGSEQVRSQATVGGNLGSASPIGDLAPLLLALNANIELVSLSQGGNGLAYRTLALSSYFVGYCDTQRANNEWIHAVSIPNSSSAGDLRVYKVSKRMDDDISTVCAALWMQLDRSQTPATIIDARVGFGGMAATPKRAAHTERALLGEAFNEATIEQASRALRQDFAPINDVRGSALYRHQVAANLLKRFWLECEQSVQFTQIHQVNVDTGLNTLMICRTYRKRCTLLSVGQAWQQGA